MEGLNEIVSMPVRAFLDSDKGRGRWNHSRSGGFNARQGIS